MERSQQTIPVNIDTERLEAIIKQASGEGVPINNLYDNVPKILKRMLENNDTLSISEKEFKELFTEAVRFARVFNDDVVLVSEAIIRVYYDIDQELNVTTIHAGY